MLLVRLDRADRRRRSRRGPSSCGDHPRGEDLHVFAKPMAGPHRARAGTRVAAPGTAGEPTAMIAAPLASGRSRRPTRAAVADQAAGLERARIRRPRRPGRRRRCPRAGAPNVQTPGRQDAQRPAELAIAAEVDQGGGGQRPSGRPEEERRDAGDRHGGRAGGPGRRGSVRGPRRPGRRRPRPFLWLVERPDVWPRGGQSCASGPRQPGRPQRGMFL